MKILELLLGIIIVGILSSSIWLSYTLALPNNTRSALTILYALKHTRLLALIDSSMLGYIKFGDIYSFARVDSKRLLSEYPHFFWQTQFHTSGIYTKNSLSIYRDTPRFANTTDFDRRPLAGDIVALYVGNGQCLSGYNNSNITGYCKNNALFDFRLYESSRLRFLQLDTPTTCQERDTFRFYFNDFGKILCGKPLLTPRNRQQILIGNFRLILEPYTGYAVLLKNNIL